MKKNLVISVLICNSNNERNLSLNFTNLQLPQLCMQIKEFVVLIIKIYIMMSLHF